MKRVLGGNNMKTFILAMILTTSVFAQTAAKLNKGESAPFSGILITEEKAQELHKAEKRALALSDLRLTDQKIIEYYKDESIQRQLELKQERLSSHLKVIGFFVLGSLLTGFAFKVAIENTK